MEESYNSLVNDLYKVLLKKYGNKIIHSSELVYKFITNPHEKESKDEAPYIISGKWMIGKLDKGEKIIFSIGGGIFFTSIRVLFCNFPLYKTKENINRPSKFDGESLFYSDIILLQRKGNDSGIYDGLSGGRFFSGLMWYVDDDGYSSPTSWKDYYGTDSFIGYGSSHIDYNFRFEYGEIDGQRRTRAHVELPKNCIINIGNDINEFLNNFILKEKSEFNLTYLPKVKQSFEKIENAKRVLDALTSNQIAFEKEELLNMVKLQSFIKNQEKILVNTIHKINGLDDSHILDLDTSFLEYIVSQHKNLNVLTDLTFRMINLKKDGDLLNYTIIYNEFENLGVFTKEFEKQLLGSVRAISDKIDKLDSSLGNLKEVMEDISSEISTLDDTVRHGLWDIHSEIMNLK